MAPLLTDGEALTGDGQAAGQFAWGGGTVSPWAAISRLATLDRVPCAGVLRVSQFQLQDARGSFIRQVGNITARLPQNFEVVAWFIDVESGRMELEERGDGDLHTLIDLPVERAGGLRDLLEEAKRRDCRFAAVVCENTERLARVTYFGAKVEHELAKRGIEVFAIDEGIELDGKKATRILLRRIKMAVGEFHALNVFEQAFDALNVHTKDGYNIGRPPYGYVAVKEPHPAPARRARGLTKSRLAVDEIRGPVVTQMFHWRVVDRLTYSQIADRLNADPDRYPAPQAFPARIELGAWSWVTVKNMLRNPKYTGYMVWNRTTTRNGMTVQRKRKHKANPQAQWVRSDTPTHPALVSMEIFDAAQRISDNERSRAGHDANSHPATQHRYRLRGYLRCPHCGRRLQGDRRDGRVYYKCAGPRNGLGERTQAEHPGTLYVREDALLPVVVGFIADRVFGQHRAAYLREQLQGLPHARAAEHERQIDSTRRTLADIGKRQAALLRELEETDPEDPTQASYRANIRKRYSELEAQRGEAETALAELIATKPATDPGDPELLDAMPLATPDRLADAPDDIVNRLFDALQLVVRVDNPRQVHITITLTADTPTGAAATLTAIMDSGRPSDPHSAVNRGDLLSSAMATLCHQDREVRGHAVPVTGRAAGWWEAAARSSCPRAGG